MSASPQGVEELVRPADPAEGEEWSPAELVRNGGNDSRVEDRQRRRAKLLALLLYERRHIRSVLRAENDDGVGHSKLEREGSA